MLLAIQTSKTQYTGLPRCLLKPLEVTDICVHGNVTLPCGARRPDVFSAAAASGNQGFYVPRASLRTAFQTGPLWPELQVMSVPEYSPCFEGQKPIIYLRSSGPYSCFLIVTCAQKKISCPVMF